MGTIYQRASKVIVDRAERLIRQHYPGLEGSKAKVDFIAAFAAEDEKGEPSGPAIMHGGYQAAGLCRILSLKDRVMGRGDAEIIIDGDRWEKWSAAEQDALLDHELYHIGLCVNQMGVLKTDDVGRPKLRIRKHDRQYGWFDEIAQRHGIASFEVRQARDIVQHARRIYFQGEFGFATAGIATDESTDDGKVVALVDGRKKTFASKDALVDAIQERARG